MQYYYYFYTAITGLALVIHLIVNWHQLCNWRGVRLRVGALEYRVFLICLLLSFMVMTAGIFMTFMMQPVLVTVKKDGYTVLGRQERMRIILNDAVHSTEGEEHHNA
jgi:hypothetical protein